MADTTTVASALENATRLLAAAEMETNLAIAEAITRIAECWTTIATLLRDLE